MFREIEMNFRIRERDSAYFGAMIKECFPKTIFLKLKTVFKAKSIYKLVSS